MVTINSHTPTAEPSNSSMSNKTITLGEAIDSILNALSGLPKESWPIALEAVSSHLGIQLPDRRKVSEVAIPERTILPAVNGPLLARKKEDDLSSIRDIRSLKEEKQPASAQQMACVVAYYLQELAPENERKATISTADLDKYFKQAKFKLPTEIGQVLKNGKKAGYFDAAERGQYKLNAVGYNLVSHGLPLSRKS